MDRTGKSQAFETVEDGSAPGAQFPFDRPVIGGFIVEAEVGRGGMGVVLRAREPNLERRVALKVMAAGLSSDTRFRRLFEDESRRAAALEHPNVLPVYRTGEESGHLYIAMRFVEDGSLKDLIDRRGRLPLGMTVRIVARVADALDAAHGHGLVHRDVKPGNILVADPGSDEEQVYLSDFGLAIPAEQALRGGAMGGTPGYLAPEQLTGGAVGPWSDVYALGCVLLHALTGQPPSRALLAGTAGAAMPDLAHLPAGISAVVARATAPNPADRYASAGALARAAAAARRYVVLVHHPDDRAAAGRLEARLRAHDLDALVSEGGDDDLATARACVVVVGRAGLGEWAHDAVAAAREVTATDPAFVLGALLLPEAPDALGSGLAAFAGRPAIDLRGDPDDSHAVPDLLRLLGAAPATLAPGAVAGCPYRGLASFGEDDAALFVGRERETAMLLEKLRGGRFLAVLGASGSGKSRSSGRASCRPCAPRSR